MIPRRTALLALLSTSVLLACGAKAPPVAAVPAGASVLALGDSLTAGVGARPGEDWPSLLAERTGWEVTNGGVSGDTSAQGLARRFGPHQGGQLLGCVQAAPQPPGAFQAG